MYIEQYFMPLGFPFFHQKEGKMSTKLSGTFLKISITPPPPSTRDNTYDYLFISCRRRFYLLWLSCQKLGGNNWRRDDQQSAQRSVSCCSASYFFYIGRAKALTLLCNRPLPRSVRPSHLFMVRHTPVALSRNCKSSGNLPSLLKIFLHILRQGGKDGTIPP